MRLIIIRLCKKRFIGGNQRQRVFISQIKQQWLHPRLVRQAVPLQLDIKPIPKRLFEFQKAGQRQVRLPLRQSPVNRPFGTTGQANQSFGLPQQVRNQNMRALPVRRRQISARGKLHQSRITHITGCQQNKGRTHLRQAVMTARSTLLFPFDR